MAVKLLALYKKPENEAAFLEYYERVHAPLAQKIPGLQKLVINRIFGAAVGEPDLYMIVELHFADRQAFFAAMQSEESKAAAADVPNFAPGILTMMFAED